ncbi:hypothetical protein RJ639_047268 [Escallonia herrerae]|uniref:Bifunctional inhibitor/plant lipid transfer protein/seed storage helical domain-containing protein n=1 Tax=Escallonia herrerae TaxID=1293975 RepID=A0AA88W739_9ASTE|nr:hypothetical protein RJ639_047268 [Escallonia herrerae]
MAKLTILAAALLALLALAEASTYRTTITTTTIEEENPHHGGSRQRCREQFQQQQQLRHCQMYMRQGSPYDAGLALAMVTGVNPQQQQHLRECCQQLRNIDEQCRCEAIRQMVRQQQMGGGSQQEQIQEMAQKAQYLPRRCNMEPQQCQIRAVWF